ncbi:MAG: phospholipid carrier-dependent glycosyltransferase [Armatimonadota bacterium]|nr:phospholipid carrier-dependent glycosyltransferase [Armatimonadota bacterium]MDR7454945.1 phospholipid carrier-dependent glycosyltransferase [Armatimonadota bacterium]MDR7457591.1 phospholipid carrier-dependent glycosyltransferase [Armatimonadota bacterium]MDR7496655.1 phospholipid carrier-dependent glycosyltransferase [Armatimonadota bacterium]
MALPASVEIAAAAPPAARRVEPLLLALVVGITLFAALVRFPRLGTPSWMIFDEIYYAKAARQILAGQEVTEERTHPPLSKLIIAAGIVAAGDNAVGWRLPGAVAGVLLVLVVYLLALLLFKDQFIAAASAMLVALDGLVFVESRIAKPDIFLTLFLFVAYTAFWMFLRARPAGAGAAAGAHVWLYLAGAAAGCAVATKWTTVVPLSVIQVTLALALGWGRLTLTRRDVLHLAAAFIAVPVAVYLLTYVPYFVRGHTAAEFVAHQRSMYEFHASLTEGHPYQSAWWSWPLLLRPIWYEYYEAADGLFRGVVAIGNPIIWWAALPALAVFAVFAARARALPDLFVVLGFAIAYVQYAFITRALFLYHFLPAVPFLVLGLAAVLARVRAQVGSGVVLMYLLLAAGWLVAFYPVLSALGVSGDRITRLMWFGSWI